jgi:glyoxalase family protein
VEASAPVDRDGRTTIDFEDPEGQRLALVDDGGGGDEPVPWERSPVPAEYQIRGLGPVLMSVPELPRTEAMVVEVMRMRRIREYAHPDNDRDAVYVFEMGSGGAHAELHVAVQPDLPVTRPGAAGVHHVAFRTPNEEEYHGWTERLSSYGLAHSGEIDRFYFKSLYVREPNGVLFEIATDGPGFLVDEDLATVGEKIALPPFLEPRRKEIEAGLQPIEA